MTDPLLGVFAPGFFASTEVRSALIVGGLVPLVTGAIGVFTVLRGQSFTGHALGEVGATGGSAAFLAGANPLWGFLAIAAVSAGFIELLGVHRPRARDLATGLVLGSGLGVAALLLYFDATSSTTTGAPVTILFGSLFAVSPSLTPTVVILSAASLLTLALSYRMLLLTSIDVDLARARGVPVRLVGLAYLGALAIAVALAAETIGAVLATALLVGPSASALALTKRPGWAVLAAGLIGVLAVWLGVLFSYDSYYWPPIGHGWPVSFFVVVDVFVFYLLTRLRTRWREHRGEREGRA